MVFWFIIFVSPPLTFSPLFPFPSFWPTLTSPFPLSFSFPFPLFLLLLPSTLAFPLHLSFPFSHLSYPHPHGRLAPPPLSILIAASCRRLVPPRGRSLFAHHCPVAATQPRRRFSHPLRRLAVPFVHTSLSPAVRGEPLSSNRSSNRHGSRRHHLLAPLL